MVCGWGVGIGESSCCPRRCGAVERGWGRWGASGSGRVREREPEVAGFGRAEFGEFRGGVGVAHAGRRVYENTEYTLPWQEERGLAGDDFPAGGDLGGDTAGHAVTFVRGGLDDLVLARVHRDQFGAELGR